MGCHFLLQGIFLTQGLNPCLLHWQVDSSPLSHQGRPQFCFYFLFYFLILKIFIYLAALALVETPGIFDLHCSMWDLVP